MLNPGEVQYGGRVTDDLDKRLLNTFTCVWFSENTFSDKFCFYKGYSIPGRAKTVQEVLQHIETLPLVDTPEVRATGCTVRITQVRTGPEASSPIRCPLVCRCLGSTPTLTSPTRPTSPTRRSAPSSASNPRTAGAAPGRPGRPAYRD